MAASLVFAVLLLSDATLVAASEQNLGDASLVDGESALYTNAQVLDGIASVELLGQAQSLLSSNEYDCNTALSNVRASLERLVFSVGSEGVLVKATGSPGPSWTTPDNLSLANPFDGGVANDLNLHVSLVSSGLYPGGRVTYSRTESHTLHLPVDLERAVSFCLWASGYVSSELSTAPEGNCTAGQIGEEFAAISASLSALAIVQGLQSSLEYTIAPATCDASFVIRVTQAGLVGPLGPFSLSLEEPGFVVLQSSGG